MNIEGLIDLLDEYIEIKIFNARCREEGVDESTKREREIKKEIITYIYSRGEGKYVAHF